MSMLPAMLVSYDSPILYPITLLLIITGVLMSYTIIPNPKLSRGCLLVLTDRAGNTKRIACHNRATAEFEARLLKAKRS